MLKPEDFSAKAQEIINNLSDQAKVSEILAELTQEHIKTVQEVEENNKLVSQTQEENKRLREANLKLFLMVGEPKKEEEQQQQKEEQKITIEDLLDGKGRLK